MVKSGRHAIMGLGALLIHAGCAAPDPGPLFQEVTDGAVADFRGVSRGAAWGDYDGDGDPDLFVTHPTYEAPDQRNALYRNQNGTFVEEASAADLAPPAGWEGVAWIDVDGDGDLDLHAVGRLGAGSAFFENRNGSLARRAEDPFQGRVSSASMACWADVDADGHLDAFLVGYREQGNQLFRGLGAWAFEAVRLPGTAVGSGSSRACVWADLDGDLLPELMIANARERNVLLRNRGSMDLAADTTSPLHQDQAYGYGISAADVNADGFQDVFVANFDATNTLFLGGPSGRLTSVELGGALQSAASKGHVWGDFDLDGAIDLFLGSGTPAPDMFNRLWLGAPGGAFHLYDEGVLATHADTSAAVASADYDGDGDLDVFVANWGGAGSADRLYENRISGRHWLMVELRGVSSNRMGVGGHVAVMVRDAAGSTRWLHRWLGASTGYAGQNEPRLHFGLGAAPGVDSLLVRWPSGEVTRLGSLEADRVVTIVEGGQVLRGPGTR